MCQGRVSWERAARFEQGCQKSILPHVCVLIPAIGADWLRKGGLQQRCLLAHPCTKGLNNAHLVQQQHSTQAGAE